MIKKLSLIALALISIKNAQAQFYIGANAGINNTKLYNISDAKADERQDYAATYKPQFGLEFGFQKNAKFSIGCAPQFYTSGQKYVGVLQGQSKEKLDAFVDLRYLRVPIFAKWYLGNANQRVTSYVQFGVYASGLLSYNEAVTITYTNPNLNDPGLLNTVLIKNSDVIEAQYNRQDTVMGFSIKMGNSFYNKLDFGFNLGYGLKLKLNNKLDLNLLLNGTYGIANVENTDSIMLIDPSNNQPSYFTISSDLTYSKYDEISGPASPKRSTYTNNRAIGLQIGLTYLLGNKQSSKTN